MNSVVVYFKQLPNPVKYTTIGYLSLLVLYNTVSTFTDSKKSLDLHRQNSHKKKFASEWEAVKYGAKEHFTERLFDSIVWPVTTIQDFIPYLVLKLHPPKK